jgi:hypothetical protein
VDDRDLYAVEAAQLGLLGRAFVQQQMPKIEVRLPRRLAEYAIASWERIPENGDAATMSADALHAILANETVAERLDRSRAATLSLIRVNILEDGRWDGDDVVVPLDPVLIGNAVEASDDLPAEET